MIDFMPHPLEIIPAEEPANIEHVTQMQIDIMKTQQDPSKRGQHPKQQALLRGVFEVSDNVPEAMRVGVLAEPRKFEALVRFSTGLLPKDSDPQAHGCAIKLLDVLGSPSGTQDFIMLDGSTFFINDVADYVSFFEAMGEGCPQRFFGSHRKEFGLQQAFSVVIASQVERQYWAELPIAMGRGAGRLTLIPDVSNAADQPPATTPDSLRDALEDFFITQRRAATYTFGVQPYVDETTTPIEDATSIWGTPFESVATLTIPPQDFTSAEQYAFCEKLSYTPWHCHPDHQPLGGIQRCRKRVYEESQRLRHRLREVEDREPTNADLVHLGTPFGVTA